MFESVIGLLAYVYQVQPHNAYASIFAQNRPHRFKPGAVGARPNIKSRSNVHSRVQGGRCCGSGSRTGAMIIMMLMMDYNFFLTIVMTRIAHQHQCCGVQSFSDWSGSPWQVADLTIILPSQYQLQSSCKIAFSTCLSHLSLQAPSQNFICFA